MKTIDINVIDSMVRLKKALESAQPIRIETEGLIMTAPVCSVLAEDIKVLLDFINRVCLENELEQITEEPKEHNED